MTHTTVLVLSELTVSFAWYGVYNWDNETIFVNVDLRESRISHSMIFWILSIWYWRYLLGCYREPSQMPRMWSKVRFRIKDGTLPKKTAKAHIHLHARGHWKCVRDDSIYVALLSTCCIFTCLPRSFQSHRYYGAHLVALKSSQVRPVLWICGIQWIFGLKWRGIPVECWQKNPVNLYVPSPQKNP